MYSNFKEKLSMATSEKLISIDERDINSGRVMEMTPSVIISVKTQLSVPSHYHALIIIDDAVVAKIKSGTKKKLIKLIGNDYVGKVVSVLYVSNRSFTAMSWGIGSLPITYEFLGGAKINVGASGTLIPEINDAYAFYRSLDKDEGTLNLTECASAITSAFRKCASKLLVEMFNEAQQPIFDTEFLVSEMHRRLNNRLCGKALDGIIEGVTFTSATVSGIRVNEEDKNAIIEKYGTRKKR
jgi:membrane protease subunit (stomatin/prohibitin family)